MKKGPNSQQSVTGHLQQAPEHLFDHKLPKTRILRGKAAFDRLFSGEARTFRHAELQLRLFISGPLPENEESVKMAFIVKRKLGKANRRNHSKRLLREAYRRHQYYLRAASYFAGIQLEGALMANKLLEDFTPVNSRMETVLEKAFRFILNHKNALRS